METYKPGQGSFARLTAVLACVVAIFLGCVELYSYMQSPDDVPLVPGPLFQELPVIKVPLTWKLLVCVAVFVGLVWLVRKWIGRPASVDALIETEQELKKVSWPTKDETMNATWIVIFVTVLLMVTLALFDTVLQSVFQLVF